MKLYYSPGACSLAAHILLHELNLPHTLEAVNLQKKTYSGGDFNKVNPKSYVPTLGLDNGEILTENVAILEYLADQKPEAGLLPKPGTLQRYRGVEWLAFISTELHKGFGPIFHKAADMEAAKQKLAQRFTTVEQALKKGPYLMGEQFSAPDAYLFVMTTWASQLGLDMKNHPQMLAFAERVGARKGVQAALAAEKKTPKS